MKTYLLAWNPKRWQWNNIAQMSNDGKSGKEVFDRWSSGVSKKPQKGDRFFLIRLGEEPRGIFASGQVEKGAFEALHWDEKKSFLGETTNYVTIKYDVLLNSDADAILPRELLNLPPLSEMHWDTQMSGVQIPDHIAIELERLWSSFTTSTRFSFPEEIEPSTQMRMPSSAWAALGVLTIRSTIVCGTSIPATCVAMYLACSADLSGPMPAKI